VVDQAGMNTYVQGLTTVTLCESRTATNYSTQYGYTTTAFPAASPEMQSITYYDDYNFDNDASNQADKTFIDDGQTAAGSGSRKGLVTGTRSRIIDSSPASFTEGYTFYDDKGRVVQSLLIQPVDATNTGTVRMSSKINLPGEVLQAKTTHLLGATVVNTLLDKFSLDTRGRLLEVRKTVNTETEKVIAGNAYNELGQLLTESLGIAGTLVLQKTDYLYNIRGWLRALNNTFSSTENDLYGMQLFYYQAFTALNSGKEQYNGNISGIKWTNKQKSGVWAAYGFVYDKGNRLNDAIYGEYTQAATDINLGYRGAEYKDRFNEYGITYDLQGNIKTLNRRGLDLDAVTGDYSVIDQLSYTTYTGNKLIRLDDAMPDIAGRGDFREKVNNATEYYYDPNGNLYKDDNKGITNIAYNFLNLPAQVNFTASNDYIRYTYNASGAKLKKTVFKGAVAQYTENYIGSYVYKTTGAAAFSTNDLQYVLAEKGRLMKSGTTFKYEYYLKDHLGNTRVVFSDVNGNGTIENNTTEILQYADYYPFGMLHNRASTLTDDNKLLYNGKELQTEAFNLDATAGEETVFDWYDYGARFYDAQIGRWHSVDPLAEERNWLTPYNFVQNSPLNRIDPTGAFDTKFEDELGNEIAQVEDGSNAVFQVKGEAQDKHYEFKEWDESQGGENEINVTSVVQEQQNLNNTNPDLEQESDGQTWCNRGTLNVLKSVESAFGAMNYMPDAEISLPIANANTLADKLAESTTYKPVDQETAFSKAESGHPVIMAWKNPTAGRSGHLATLSVGQNIQKGQIANIGPAAYTGFVNLNTAFSKDKQSSIVYYIINYKK
jgi:RHS repeat-associated protein